MWLQNLLKATCFIGNGRYSNSLNAILLGWLPINKLIDFYIIKLARKALHVTSLPSHLKLSFKKLCRHLRNRDAVLINKYDKNSNTFNGKARIFFNNLPYQVRSVVLKFLKRGREIYTRSGPPKKIFSTSLVNRFNLIYYSIYYFVLHVSLVTWKNFVLFFIVY